MADDLSQLFRRIDCTDVFYAVRNKIYESRVSYPRSSIVPGEPILNGLMKHSKREALFSFLSKISRNPPIDLLIYCPEVMIKSDSAMSLIQRVCAADAASSNYTDVLTRFGGMFICLHDAEQLTFIAIKESLIKNIYREIIHMLATGVRYVDVKKCWANMKSNNSQAQIATGYSKTVYFRYVSKSVLLCEDVMSMLSWNIHAQTIYRAGSFDPMLSKKDGGRIVSINI